MSERCRHIFFVNGIYLHGVPDVDCEIADEQEHDEVPPRLGQLVLPRVAAPSQAVDNEGRLDQDLDELES